MINKKENEKLIGLKDINKKQQKEIDSLKNQTEKKIKNNKKQIIKNYK